MRPCSAWPGPKVPKRGEIVNEAPKTALSPAPEKATAGRQEVNGRRRGITFFTPPGGAGPPENTALSHGSAASAKQSPLDPGRGPGFFPPEPDNIPDKSSLRLISRAPEPVRCFKNSGWLLMDTSHLAEHAGTAGTLFASVFVVATTTMRTMIPLRVFGILTNIVLITSSIATRNYPTGLLHAVLLVLNSYRLHQMLQLVRDVKRSVNSDLSMEWLKPFMTERRCVAGEMLFYKDEKAEDMLYIVSGRFRLVESGIELPVGAIVGELGMLSPSNMRTQSLECIGAGVILSVSYSKVEELYVQNPAFGFYFLRLASARLFENIDKLEKRLEQQTAPGRVAAAAKPA